MLMAAGIGAPALHGPVLASEEEVDNVPPQVLGAELGYVFTGQMIYFVIDEDVSGTIANSSLQIKNLQTNAVIPESFLEFHYSEGAASWYVLGTGILPSGSYAASLVGVTDAAGNAVTGHTVYRFIFSSGTSGDDQFRLALNAADPSQVDLFENDEVTPAYSATAATLDLISVIGREGVDTFVLDVRNGAPPNPAAPIGFDGGDDTDSIVLLGSGGVDSASFGIGTVTFDGTILNHSAEAQIYRGGGGYDNVNVDAGYVFFDRTEQIETLSIAWGAVAVVLPGHDKALVVHTLNVPDEGWQLDLTDNAMVLSPPGGSWDNGAYTGAAGQLQAGRGSGVWDGSGIITSTPDARDPGFVGTLAIADGGGALGLSGAQTQLWNGVAVSASSILIAHTFAGDANLDGAIDGDDFFQIDAHAGLVGGVVSYFNGDFDYNGWVDADDYFLIDSNYNKAQAAAAPAVSGAIVAIPTSTFAKRSSDDETAPVRLVDDVLFPETPRL
jgi:hypothetical protein